MKDNFTTIKYSIQNEKFKYNTRKSELKKGSLVFRGKHPLKEVENYKESLKRKKLLKRYDDNYYQLNKTIKVGGLMAFNLCSKELKKEFEIDYPIVINHRDEAIKQEFEINNIVSTDSIFHNNVNINALKMIDISELESNFDFISEHDPNNFSPIENLIKKILISFNYISKVSRHGIAEKDECDIVDEITGKQVEVVTEFKNRLKYDKTPQKNIEALVVECVDNNLIHTSPALIKKYVKNNYTDTYEKQLAIFCIGSKRAVSSMLKKLSSNLNRETVKNNFSVIYLLYYDLITETYYWYPSRDNKVIKLDNIKEKMIYKRKINYSDMKDNNKYLMTCINIFNEETLITYLTKSEIESFVTKMKIIL